MQHYTNTIAEVTEKLAGRKIKIAGWLHNKRNHGGVLFLDIRAFGEKVQVVIETQEIIDFVSRIKLESVVVVTGLVKLRPQEAINLHLHSGKVEIFASHVEIESESEQIPFQININDNISEDLRLQYRFLDLRTDKMRENILLRSSVISYIRKRMEDNGFVEFQTPILTASSPEGARDFLVPSRLNPGKFYALPQAPQQFKQMLMVSGFEKYFQIAPCFRDEDARADRSPGEFYQLDIEMAFMTQDEIFASIEPVLYDIFVKFGKKSVSQYPFQRITYAESMLKYGNDKPDLRNPIEIFDATEIFEKSGFGIFANAIKNGSIVRAIPVPYEITDATCRKYDSFVKEEKLGGGLAYILFKDGIATENGMVSKRLTAEQNTKLAKMAKITKNGTIFFVCDESTKSAKLAGLIRTKVAQDLNLIDTSKFEFCWIVDFPFYEWNEDDKKIEFSHNPFSMPQGGMEALINSDPLTIKAYQYDIVCNGIELSSGAIRNHKLNIMFKAFEIAGYTAEEVRTKFAGMVKAFSYGAPPHGGLAPGIDRMVMLLAGTESIRDIIPFPLNGKAQDLLMNAPSEVTEKQLRELGLQTRKKATNE